MFIAYDVVKTTAFDGRGEFVACAMAGFVAVATPPREKKPGEFLIAWPAMDVRTFGNNTCVAPIANCQLAIS